MSILQNLTDQALQNDMKDTYLKNQKSLVTTCSVLYNETAVDHNLTTGLNILPDDVPLDEVDLSVELGLHAVQHLGELLDAVLARLEGADVVGGVGLPAVRRREGPLRTLQGPPAVPVVVDALRAWKFVRS